MAGSPQVTWVVDTSGRISIGGFRYHIGRWLALETVEVASGDGPIGHQRRACTSPHTPAGTQPNVNRPCCAASNDPRELRGGRCQ